MNLRENMLISIQPIRVSMEIKAGRTQPRFVWDLGRINQERAVNVARITDGIISDIL